MQDSCCRSERGAGGNHSYIKASQIMGNSTGDPGVTLGREFSSDNVTYINGRSEINPSVMLDDNSSF